MWNMPKGNLELKKTVKTIVVFVILLTIIKNPVIPRIAINPFL